MIYNTVIIGSGISGIFTLKHLIEDGITNVIILDKNPEPFGVWNINNKPSVFKDTYTVSSKLYMTISDFPIPENTPEFPHHSLILHRTKRKLILCISFLSVGGLHQKEKCLIFLFGWCKLLQRIHETF